jgi:hypothetical protein
MEDNGPILQAVQRISPFPGTSPVAKAKVGGPTPSVVQHLRPLLHLVHYDHYNQVIEIYSSSRQTSSNTFTESVLL